MTQGEPSWDRLPHDPKAFFDLADDFDRKALKRAYNGLIRKYKPEKHPAEFQRIREAFEALDAQLRYGRQDFRQQPVSTDWEQTKSPAPAPKSNADEVEQPARPTESPRERLERELTLKTVKEVYGDLQKQKQKRPFDYYALALLSDSVEKDPLIFLKWLLTGLQDHSEDPALFRLLHVFFMTRVPEKEAGKVVLTTSKIVHDDRYYFLTEKLWDKLLQRLPFEQFVQLLQKCESNLSDYRIEAKVAFYIHILRPALFKAPRKWIDNVFRFLNENSEYISPDLEYELEFANQIIEYLERERAQKERNPIRTRIRAAVQDYCSLEQVEADRKIIELQTHLATNAGELLGAFPVSQNEDDEDGIPGMAIWGWITEDVQARSGLDTEVNISFGDLTARVMAMLQDIDEKESHTVWLFLHFGRYGAHIIATIGLLFAPLFLFGSFLPQNEAMTGGLVFVGVSIVIAYWMKLKDLTVSAWFEKQTERTLHKAYHRRWRTSVVRLISSTHMPFDAVLEALVGVVTTREADLGVSTWVPAFAYRDTGLWLYASAQQYLR